MARLARSLLAAVLAAAVVVLTPGCVIYDEKGKVEVPPSAVPPSSGHDQIVGLTTTDGAVVRFQKPARVEHGFVTGKSEGQNIQVSLEKVHHLVVRQVTVNTSKTVLATLGIVVGIAVGIAAIMAASKQSCPFVYSWDGTSWVFDAEPYGGSISRGLERADDVRLDHLVPVDGQYRLLLTNEVQETQRTNHVALRVVDHARGTQVVPGAGGRLHAIRDLRPVASARTAGGRDVTAWLARSDELVLETEPAVGPAGETRDELVLSFPKPRDASLARLVVDAGTTLFGSNMIRETLMLRGREVTDWLAAIDTEPAAVDELNRWHLREELWLLRIDVEEPTGWETRGTLLGTGPVVSKERVVPLDVSRAAGDTLRLRVRPPKGFWTLDSFAVDYGPDTPLEETVVEPSEARDATGGDHRAALVAADGAYDVMPIGGAPVALTFPVPPPKGGLERTVFLRAQGFYELDLPASGEPDRAALERLASEPGYGVRLAAERYRRWTGELGAGAASRR